ncbi:guanylate kinase [Oleispirillum naphthae]|uniref:guanylate kinase n=1 Tax=Oleispirillum naphthae TaxID=2838853 RepID=UPI003082585C
MSSSPNAGGVSPASLVSRRGLLLVLSSPSGAGKTTIARNLLAADPLISASISVTTRPQRPSEQEKRDYYFIDKARFDEMVAKGELLEHALVFGNYYGTPKKPVEDWLAMGRDVLFDIDWQGAQQLEEKMSNDLVRIFVLPPSMAELERRLRSRAQDSETVLQGRMAKAADEMSHWIEYDYIIINRDAAASTRQALTILNAERQKRARLTGMSDFIGALRDQM